ncbi:MAG: hypothetical protein RR636_09130 [Clostridium sp.]|uniref:hypothetical protein n=1 Tax=Clostridium sp. TaxID=1506 RepID=UPI003217A4FD
MSKFSPLLFLFSSLNILIVLGSIAGFICLVVCIFKINKSVKVTNSKLDEIIKLHQENITNEKLDQVIEVLKKDIN